jgi:hypothetical protein
MPYLGSTPNASFSTRTKQDFTANGSTTAFTLSSAVASPNDIEVFVGNVRQEPTDAYTVNGTTLTMSEAPDVGLNFYVVFKGLEENSIIPADGTISSGKIAANAVTNAKIAGMAASKLTGALPAVAGAALTDMGMVKLAEVNSVATVSAVDISLDYSDYNSFQLNMYILGDNTSSGQNLDVRYKRDGQSSFDTSTVYGTQNILVDNGTSRNENGTNSSVELFTTNYPSHGWTSHIIFNGFGSTTRPSDFQFFCSKSGGGISTWIGGGGYNTNSLKLERVTDIRLSFTGGNVTELRYELYGLK